jgi:hypothetical protein
LRPLEPDPAMPSPLDGRQTIPRGTRGSSQYLSWLFLPRRQAQDFGQQVTKTTLAVEAQRSPYRLLTYLPDIHPAVSYSCFKNLRMLIPPEGLAVVGGSYTKTGSFEKNDEATRILKDFWDAMPDEIGGLHGLQTTLAYTLMFTGMVALEAVPGELLKGLYTVWPVDPLTLVFKRMDRNAPVTAFQKQVGPLDKMEGLWLGQYQQLRPSTFFWRSLDAYVDDPYGRPMYSTAIGEVLLNIAIIQDLRDAVHANAWPVGVYGFNFEKAYEIAQKIYGVNDLKKAKDWVDSQFKTIVDNLKAKNPDDWVISDTNGSVAMLPVPNFSGLDSILKFFEKQLFWSIKELPVMMGSAGDASSESYVTQQMQIAASTYETLRAILLTPIVKTANLHFRLLGKPYIAQPEYDKIRTADAMNAEELKQLEIRNQMALRDEGYQSHETTGINLTGSAPDNKTPPPPVWERQAPPQEPKTRRNISGESRTEQTARTSANK